MEIYTVSFWFGSYNPIGSPTKVVTVEFESIQDTNVVIKAALSKVGTYPRTYSCDVQRTTVEFSPVLEDKARKVKVDLDKQGWNISLQAIYRVLESAQIQGLF